MKVCFLTNTPFAIGGVERVLSVITSELVNYYDVTIACTVNRNQDYDLFKLNRNVKIDVIPSLILKKEHFFVQGVIRKINSHFRLKNVSLLTEAYYPGIERNKFINYLNKRKFDVVIGVQDQYALLLAIIAKNVNARCLGWFHSSYRAYFETPYKYSWHRDLLFQTYLPNLKVCVALTLADEQKCSSIFHTKFVHIYNPLTCEVGTERLLDKNRVLMVGRLLYNTKGLDFFVDIAKIILQNNSKIQFIIVGDGPDRKKLEKELLKNHLNENVTLVGSSTNVSKYYSKARVLISTSRWEGFGLVITEAMAHGVPVISFCNEGPREIIRSGVDGFLVHRYDCNEFAEKLLLLLNNDTLHRQMGNNAKIRSDQFEIKKILQQWKNIIEE